MAGIGSWLAKRGGVWLTSKANRLKLTCGILDGENMPSLGRRRNELSLKRVAAQWHDWPQLAQYIGPSNRKRRGDHPEAGWRLAAAAWWPSDRRLAANRIALAASAA